jgi:hypothetical protein
LRDTSRRRPQPALNTATVPRGTPLTSAPAARSESRYLKVPPDTARGASECAWRLSPPLLTRS